MKLYGVTVVYNEELLIPVVMPYLEKMGYDKLVVWDNGSTDKTVALLAQYPFIEIRRFDTPHFIEDEKLKRIVDTVSEFNRIPCEDGEQVWVSICDFDEVFQYNAANEPYCTFRDYLWWMGVCGYNVCREHLWNLMENGSRVEYGAPFYWNKPNLFRVDGMGEFSIVYGQHDLSIKYKNGEPKIWYNTKVLSAFHLKFYNREIFLKRQSYRNERKVVVWGEYGVSCYDDNVLAAMDEYEKHLKLSLPYEKYFMNKILTGEEFVGEFLV